MRRHEVHFTNLIDWLDNQLSAEERQRIEAHLANCPTCQRDLAWLQRVVQAARSDDTVAPPAEAVAQVKALFRAHKMQLAQREQRWVRMPRFAFALALTLVLLISIAVYLSRVPTLFAREATLAMMEGTIEMQRSGTGKWQAADMGEILHEGDGIRVVDGTATIALFEGSVLGIQQGSELVFSVMRSGLFGATYNVVLQQPAGEVDYNVAPLRSSLCRFEAYAPTVRVAVRGTRFVITVQDQKQTQVTVLQGRVEVTSATTKTVLTEREVAIVPANAPLIYLPTLTPLPTPEPSVSKTPLLTSSPTVAVLPSPSAIDMSPAPRGEGSHRTATPPSVTTHPMPSETPTPSTSVTVTPTLPLRGNQVLFQGTIESFPPRLLGLWTVDGQTIVVTPRTQIRGTPEVGRQARGTALAIAAQPLMALEIEIEEPQLGETPLPSPTPQLGPHPVRTPQPGLGPHPVRTPQPMLTIGPGQWPSPVITLPAIRTPQPMATLLPRRTPQWAPTPPSVPSPQPSASPEATTTPLATEFTEATPTPLPTWPTSPGPQPRR